MNILCSIGYHKYEYAMIDVVLRMEFVSAVFSYAVCERCGAKNYKADTSRMPTLLLKGN